MFTCMKFLTLSFFKKKNKRNQIKQKKNNNKLTHHNMKLDNNFYKISVNFEDLVMLDNIHMLI
jgi:hypothetical protein